LSPLIYAGLHSSLLLAMTALSFSLSLTGTLQCKGCYVGCGALQPGRSAVAIAPAFFQSLEEH
jgi:hypothetical protein